MKRLILGTLAIGVVLLLAGCSSQLWDAGLPGGSNSLELVSEQVGWVELQVNEAGTLHWGDGYDDCHFCEVSPGVYTHYYTRPACYLVSLERQGKLPVELCMPITRVCGHLELVSIEGYTVTVKHWGLPGKLYCIDWGEDGYAEEDNWEGSQMTISVDEYYAKGQVRTHTYCQPGSYTIGLSAREIDLGAGDEAYRPIHAVMIR